MSNHITPTTPVKGQAPMIFMFMDHAVRIITKDGEEWFVAADVAKAIGYTHTPHMLRAIDKDCASIHIVDTSAGPRESIIISEAGMYQAIFVSRKPEAQAFRRWVAEVLRQIRKTGLYVAPTKPARAVLRLGKVQITRQMEFDALTMFLQGHDKAEIARTLGISRTTVGVMVRGQYRFGPNAGPDITTPEMRLAVANKCMGDERDRMVERIQTKYCISSINMGLALEYDREGRKMLAALGAPMPEEIERLH